MKKNLFFFVLVLLLNFSVFSQETNNFENLTSGKWSIESVKIESDFMDVHNQGCWMVFYPNGLYQIMLDKEEQVGTWKLNESNEIKFDFESYEGDSLISQIDEHHLKFSISGYTLELSR